MNLQTGKSTSSSDRRHRVMHSRPLKQVVFGGFCLVALLATAWLWTFKELGEGIAAEDVNTTLEVVPAIVIAVLIFGVGITFVVAQVVPAARGTRAAGRLTGMRVDLTVSPAIGLLGGATILLLSHNVSSRPDAWWRIGAEEMAVVLAGATLLYVVSATASLAQIYRDATDPDAFRKLLTRWGRLRWRGPGGSQRRVDEVYDRVRTLRGWARTAAMSGDSRELHEALRGFLELCERDSQRLGPHDIVAQPRRYLDQPTRLELNPMHGPRDKDAGCVPGPQRPWLVPPLRPAAREADWNLYRPTVWFPNEVARAITRVLEIGFENHTLLDRDLFRLLNTLGNAALIYCPDPEMDEGVERNQREWCAGVMIRSLAGAGLAAGSATERKPEWFYEPAIQLGRLWQEFKRNAILADGCAAGMVSVLCTLEKSIVNHDVDRSVTVVQAHLGRLPRISFPDKVEALAASGLFESPHHPRINTIERLRLTAAIKALQRAEVPPLVWPGCQH